MDDDGAAPERAPERADAARNRRRILDAAAELFRTAPNPARVTMGDIAQASGVGRATLYRKFPDVSAVALALLDLHEARLQRAMMRGPAPLGPGAPPADRLAAFYSAMVTLLDEHLHLVLGAETGGSRYETGAYGAWRLHVRSLLLDAGMREPDPWVDVLLAPLAPETFRHQREVRGLSAQQVGSVLGDLAKRVLREPAS